MDRVRTAKKPAVPTYFIRKDSKYLATEDFDNFLSLFSGELSSIRDEIDALDRAVHPAKQVGKTEMDYANINRHPLSEKFHALLREAGELHDKKQADYGVDNDPFANVRASTDWGVEPWVGALIRANDKIKRLQAFAQKGSLKNESARDSLMDISVYCLIAIVLMEEETNATDE